MSNPKPTLHVLGLPHTQTTYAWSTCAYTMKIVKFCKMMRMQGYPVRLYSGEQNEADCAEHIPLVTEAWRVQHYGPHNPNGLWANVDWSPQAAPWETFNARAIDEIRQRAQPHDFLLPVMGWSQQPVAQAFPHLLPVEWAVGYEGIALPHRVFESYAWMHHVYGLKAIKDGAFYDAVIPNFFDPAEFPLPSDEQKGDYLLFLGRLTARKGPHVAAQIAERAGLRLLVAGPGAIHVEPGRIVTPEIAIEGSHVEYVGPVGIQTRARLLAGARALLVPTLYIEPFGGVAVEAMMTGTPVVATDWGAFVETVVPETGRRFRTLAEGAVAVHQVQTLEPAQIRAYALARFGLVAVGQQFDQHFQRLATLWGEGWNQ